MRLEKAGKIMAVNGVFHFPDSSSVQDKSVVHEGLRSYYANTNTIRMADPGLGIVVGAHTHFNDEHPGNYYPLEARDAIGFAQAYSLNRMIRNKRARSLGGFAERSVEHFGQTLFIEVPADVDPVSRTILADSPFLASPMDNSTIAIPQLSSIPQVVRKGGGKPATSYLLNRTLVVVNSVAPILADGSGGTAASSIIELPRRDEANLSMTIQMYNHLLQLSLGSIYAGKKASAEEMVQYFDNIDLALKVFFGFDDPDHQLTGMRDNMYQIFTQLHNITTHAFNVDQKSSTVYMLQTNTHVLELIPQLSEAIALATKAKMELTPSAFRALNSDTTDGNGAKTLLTSELAYSISLSPDCQFLLPERFRTNWLSLAMSIQEALKRERVVEPGSQKSQEQIIAEDIVQLVVGDNQQDKLIGEITAHLLKTFITSIRGYQNFMQYPEVAASAVIARNFARLVEASAMIRRASEGRMDGPDFSGYLAQLAEDMLVDLDIVGLEDVDNVPNFFVATILELLNDAEAANTAGSLQARVQFKNRGNTFSVTFTDKGIGIPDSV
ncbi:hypothetical protein KC909_06525, partial [Candidatus Dojkabacteria bacterium]|nr:hypothetical protein [Candidatus Dojkabacteria bacterium]